MSNTPIADMLQANWEVMDAERKKAIGPNPKVVYSMTVQASEFHKLFAADPFINPLAHEQTK